MITKRLIDLARAIEHHEGWNALSGGGSNKAEPTISYRNHNPGNLRSSPFQVGERGGFAVFENYDVGFFGLVWDLWSKCNGRTSTGLTPESSIEDLIYVWAPPNENDTPKYVETVCRRLGVEYSERIGNFVGR